MLIRCALLVAMIASCRGEPPRDPLPLPQAMVEVERVAVPGSKGAAAATAVAPITNPPLRPEEGRLDVLSPEPTQSGTETTAHVRLVAHRGYEINEKFHYKLTLEPTPGVTLAKSVFTQAGDDAERVDGHELAFAMKLTADRPGDYTVRGRLDFAVCKIDSQCLPKTMPVAVLVAAR
jgi:hypothetical protein